MSFLELVVTLIALYLILSHGQAFSSVVKSIGGVFNDSAKTLQGR